MRVESDYWSLAGGVKIGHYHMYNGKNCQDKAVVVATPKLVVGVGCDGCGSGTDSEMGAIALANFTTRSIIDLVMAGFSGNELRTELFRNIIQYINTNVKENCPLPYPAARAEFIKNHWLATVCGLILGKDQAAVFWCGDPVIAYQGVKAPHDPLYSVIDENNSPRYIAYNCLSAPESVGVIKKAIPTFFEYMDLTDLVCPGFEVSIASDGFVTHNANKFKAALEIEPDLPLCLNGQQWGRKGQTGLKRWMNTRSERGYFEDDCFIIEAKLS